MSKLYCCIGPPSSTPHCTRWRLSTEHKNKTSQGAPSLRGNTTIITDPKTYYAYLIVLLLKKSWGKWRQKRAHEKCIGETLLSLIRIALSCSAKHPCYYVSSPPNSHTLMTHSTLSQSVLLKQHPNNLHAYSIIMYTLEMISEFISVTKRCVAQWTTPRNTSMGWDWRDAATKAVIT